MEVEDDSAGGDVLQEIERVQHERVGERVRLWDAICAGVVEVPLERLRPWAENPRRIRPERLEELKRALSEDREMLRARPLLALLDGTVIAGNQRLLAATELGWRTAQQTAPKSRPELTESARSATGR